MSVIKLKVCGIQTPHEAKELTSAGVAYLGLNFVPTSKRCISLEAAGSIVATLPGRSVKIVALFQDQPVEMVNDYAMQLGADFVQLHGEETPEYVSRVQVPVIKAFSVDPHQSIVQMLEVMRSYPVAHFLLDRYRQGEGDVVKLELAQKAIEAFPDRVFLAGGLSPDNLENVLTHVRPYGIDIASGVRSGETLDLAKVKNCLRLLAAV
jgi:phosphoribosylanthranilate isomerase